VDNRYKVFFFAADKVLLTQELHTVSVNVKRNPNLGKRGRLRGNRKMERGLPVRAPFKDLQLPLTSKFFCAFLIQLLLYENTRIMGGNTDEKENRIK